MKTLLLKIQSELIKLAHTNQVLANKYACSASYGRNLSDWDMVGYYQKKYLYYRQLAVELIPFIK